MELNAKEKGGKSFKKSRKSYRKSEIKLASNFSSAILLEDNEQCLFVDLQEYITGLIRIGSQTPKRISSKK